MVHIRTYEDVIMKALVIDDSRAMRSILKKILKELDFESDEAGDGREGLVKLRAMVKPELILVDWNMPEMNGYEFVLAVRADPAYDDVKLVMVTTESEVAQVTRALDAGANEYVMKPFTADILRDKLDMLGLVPTA